MHYPYQTWIFWAAAGGEKAFEGEAVVLFQKGEDLFPSLHFLPNHLFNCQIWVPIERFNKEP